MPSVCKNLTVGAAGANVDVQEVSVYIAGTSTKITSVAANTPVDIVVWVSNTGSTVNVRCDLSSNGLTIGTKTAIVGTYIPPDAFQFVYLNTQFVTAGSYTLAGKAYVDGTQVGSTKSTVLTVTPPATSDLVFTADPTFTPANPSVGQQVMIKVFYKNPGTVPSTPCTLVFKADGLTIQSYSIPSMPAGNTGEINAYWTPQVAKTFNMCAEFIV